MEDGNKNGDLACHAAEDVCMSYAILSYINSHDTATFEVKWRNRDNFRFCNVNCIKILGIFQVDEIPKSLIFIIFKQRSA